MASTVNNKIGDFLLKINNLKLNRLFSIGTIYLLYYWYEWTFPILLSELPMYNFIGLGGVYSMIGMANVHINENNDQIMLEESIIMIRLFRNFYMESIELIPI